MQAPGYPSGALQAHGPRFTHSSLGSHRGLHRRWGAESLEEAEGAAPAPRAPNEELLGLWSPGYEAPHLGGGFFCLGGSSPCVTPPPGCDLSRHHLSPEGRRRPPPTPKSAWSAFSAGCLKARRVTGRVSSGQSQSTAPIPRPTGTLPDSAGCLSSISKD